MRLAIAVALLAAPAFPEAHKVWKAAPIARDAAFHQGPGYAIRLRALAKLERSATGETADQILWIRGGAGRVSVGSPARLSEIAPGDLVRLPRATPYTIEPAGGKLEFIAVRVTPFAPGQAPPPGQRPTRGQMGDVLKKAEIDDVIARTEANAPLHAQDNFTMNYVLFKQGRVGPWEAHANCADIYLLQTGEGTLQLGGVIQNPKENSPGEPRGTAMTGSEDNSIAAGDLVLIPRNGAHHMNPKTLPLVYVLIKVWSQ